MNIVIFYFKPKKMYINGTLHSFRIKTAASKWWFYIYSLVESCTSSIKTESNETHSKEEVIKTLQKFMEQSTLGEFEARLDILFSFHCHVVHLSQTSQRGKKCHKFLI